ncbi:MAG: glycosyltransferase family 39 protein [Nitrospirae bacterium]|nr:glycosyltransferase family 39 protein [Nitrospirota bacterium]
MFHIKDEAQRPQVLLIIAGVITTVMLWALSISIVLHNQEIVVAAWQSKPVTKFYPVANHTYEAFLDKNDFSPPSASIVYENGVPLGPGNSNAPSISCLGMGRYQFRYDRLHFSTSDNTDPRTNGRFYEIKWPVPIPPLLSWFVFGLMIAVTAISYYFVRNLDIWVCAGDYLRRHRKGLSVLIIAVSFGIVIVPFLITRLPFYLYYQVIAVHPDTAGYMEIVDSMDKGMLPSLYLRPPGYPIFMKLVFLISNKLFSVVITQSALALIASLVFVFAVFRTYRGLTPLAAIALAAFSSSHACLESEITILSESVYVSVLVLAFGLLIMALRLRKPLYFTLFSIAAASALYIRPAGIFLIVIVLLTLIYLAVNRYKRNNVAALAVPFSSLLLILAFYNLFTFHSFSLNNNAELTLIAGVSALLEQDGRYSKELNAAIKKIQDRMAPHDREVLETTWDPEKYDKVMTDAYNNTSGDKGVAGPIIEATGNLSQQKLYRIYKDLYLDVIKRNPWQFFRKTIITFLAYQQNTAKEHEIYSILNMLYNDMYVQKNTMCNSLDITVGTLCKEYSNPRPLPYFGVQESECGGIVNYIPTVIQGIHYKIFSKLHRLLFRSLLWPALNLYIFVMSVYYLIRCRYRNTGAFILFIMSSSAIMSALIVGLSTFPNIRYSYTTEFIYYAGAALLPILWKDVIKSTQG